MPDRESDKDTLRIDRAPDDAAKDPNQDTLRIDRSGSAAVDDDKTAPSAPPVRLDDDATAPAAKPVKLPSEEATAPAAAPVRVEKDDTAPAASPVRVVPASEPPASTRSPTWRRTITRALTILSVLGVVLLLPTLVRQVRSLLSDRSAERGRVVPIEDAELPPDPPLSAVVQDLLRRGREAEDSMRLAEARGLYYRAAKLEKKCSSCWLRLNVVERRIEAFSVAALTEGKRFLDEGRFEEAAKSFQSVLNLVPNENANFNLVATAGLAEARKRAKQAGRPIP